MSFICTRCSNLVTFICSNCNKSKISLSVYSIVFTYLDVFLSFKEFLLFLSKSDLLFGAVFLLGTSYTWYIGGLRPGGRCDRYD